MYRIALKPVVRLYDYASGLTLRHLADWLLCRSKKYSLYLVYAVKINTANAAGNALQARDSITVNVG